MKKMRWVAGVEYIGVVHRRNCIRPYMTARRVCVTDDIYRGVHHFFFTIYNTYIFILREGWDRERNNKVACHAVNAHPRTCIQSVAAMWVIISYNILYFCEWNDCANGPFAGWNNFSLFTPSEIFHPQWRSCALFSLVFLFFFCQCIYARLSYSIYTWKLKEKKKGKHVKRLLHYTALEWRRAFNPRGAFIRTLLLYRFESFHFFLSLSRVPSKKGYVRARSRWNRRLKAT